MQKIKEIYNQEIEHLVSAVKQASNPYHTFSLSTINENFPENRTVVLRNILSKPLTIFFNADYRSNKVKELINNQNACALFYDQSRKIQIRMNCNAIVHHKNNIALKIWNNTALQSRKCYLGPYTPSIRLDNWHPNVPDDCIDTNPTDDQSKKGYENFTHIELNVLEIDILKLRYNGHIRFKVDGQSMYYVSP